MLIETHSPRVKNWMSCIYNEAIDNHGHNWGQNPSFLAWSSSGEQKYKKVHVRVIIWIYKPVTKLQCSSNIGLKNIHGTSKQDLWVTEALALPVNTTTALTPHPFACNSLVTLCTSPSFSPHLVQKGLNCLPTLPKEGSECQKEELSTPVKGNLINKQIDR